jgi:hypothetical protein
MTAQFKVIMAVGIIVIIGAIVGITRWSATRHSMQPAGAADAQTADGTPLPPPTGNVNDLFLAIDQSNASEGVAATSETDQTPRGEASDFGQSANTNGY